MRIFTACLLLCCSAAILFAQERKDQSLPGQPATRRPDQPALRSMAPIGGMLSPEPLETQASISPLVARLSRCPLTAELQNSIAQAITRHQYREAEADLVAAIKENPLSTDLLGVAAGVFFLDHEFLNTAIALKKADHIQPLQDQDRFTLSLSYIALHRGEWARPELQKLITDNPRDPVFLYWLARVDYDERRYADAIIRLKKAVELDPNFAKGYDNLGLSLEANGDLEPAMAAYSRAAELNRQSSSPSPWPPLNFGALLLRVGRPNDAEPALIEALKYNPNVAQAHYRLGLVYDKEGHAEQAIVELRRASQLDSTFSDPLYALGRIYRRLGDEPHAEEAFGAFRKIKSAENQELNSSPGNK